MVNEIARVIGTIERISRKSDKFLDEPNKSKGSLKFYNDPRYFIVDDIDDPDMPTTETEILLTYEFWDWNKSEDEVKKCYRAKNIRPTAEVDEVELEGVERIKS